MQAYRSLSSVAHAPLLKATTVKDLISGKRKLVEVPYTASLAHAMNALVANNVVAVPVAAPPGHWIGAGGSMILESDGTTGAIRKHYIGMVTMLDILLHIADYDGDVKELPADALEARMGVPVSSIIGHCLEGLSLWTLNPNTSVLDCMEVFSKGIHRALVPVDGQMEHVVGAELAEAAPGYRMLTQMDVLNLVNVHDRELKGVLAQTVGELGAINENVLAVTNHSKVLDTIKSMRTASLNAVPIVESLHVAGENHRLIDGKGRKLVGTFSATDLKGCPITQLRSWLSLDVVEFTEKVTMGPRLVEFNAKDDWQTPISKRVLVTCNPHTCLGEVISKAVGAHVHRVWVVDSNGLLRGLVALTDMLRVIRASTLRSES